MVERIKGERGKVFNLYGMLLHSPPVAEGWLAFLTAIRQKCSFSARIRELVIMRIAVMNGANYEFQAHTPFALAEGITAQQIASLAAGDVNLCSTPLSKADGYTLVGSSPGTAIGPAQAHIKAGTLRPLAVFGDTRLKAYPDVPTLKEMGYKVGSPLLYGISAPKGTPKEVVNALHEAVKKVTEKYNEQIATNLGNLGAQIKVLGPDDYAAYLKNQNQLFSAAIKTLK